MHSAYREHHSTEMALMKVKNDILMNIDMGHVTLLVLLALNAAFDIWKKLWTMTFLFIDFSHYLAYVGQLFNGFDPIWEVDRNKLQLMVFFPKSLA